MARVLLLVPTATYRAPDFLAAARALHVDVVVASDERQTLADSMGDRALVVPLDDPAGAEQAIVELHTRAPLDAVVAVDDQGLLVSARVAERLGLRHSSPAAAAATRDKAEMRRMLAAARVPQPRFAVASSPEQVPDLLPEVGLPCVVKPTGLSASRGVIRADDAERALAAAQRAWEIAGGGPLLVEEYVRGTEVALEGLIVGGDLRVLAVFDKPDPLEGPYFEETLYVTPSRLDPPTLARVEDVVRDATAALGLTEGPAHGEVRVDGERALVVEVAARTIGGLCGRSLRFGAGISLEELILRHALGLSLDGLTREPAASGVMMLPIPRAGTLEAVNGRERALAVPGVVGLELTVALGRHVQPLPEGDRYLGFVFARGKTPEQVEAALREAHGALEIVISDAQP